MSDELDSVPAIGEAIGPIIKDNLPGVKSDLLSRIEATQASIKGLMQVVEKDMSTYESAIRTLETKATRCAEVAKEIESNRDEAAKRIQQISLAAGTNAPIDAELKKNYDDLESRISATIQETNDLSTNYKDLLQSSQRRHAHFAHRLSHLDTEYSSLWSQSHRVGAKKRAKKGADEPMAPGASVPARVESPSSPSY